MLKTHFTHSVTMNTQQRAVYFNKGNVRKSVGTGAMMTYLGDAVGQSVHHDSTKNRHQLSFDTYF